MQKSHKFVDSIYYTLIQKNEDSKHTSSHTMSGWMKQRSLVGVVIVLSQLGSVMGFGRGGSGGLPIRENLGFCVGRVLIRGVNFEYLVILPQRGGRIRIHTLLKATTLDQNSSYLGKSILKEKSISYVDYSLKTALCPK